MISVPEQYITTIFLRHVRNSSYNRYSKSYNGSCPFCKEGASLGKKKRFYFITKTQTLFCHNCGYSHKPLRFILDITGNPLSVIINELKENDYTVTDVSEPEVIEQEVVKTKTLPDDCINLAEITQVEFYKDNTVVRQALELIEKRKLHTGVNSPETFYVSLTDKVHKNRLVIPFYDVSGDIIYYQTRTILDKDNFLKPKYLSKVGEEKSLYGIHNIDPDLEYIYILEGPIDSFFVQNGVAVCGIQDRSDRTFTELQEQQLSTYPLHKKVWLLDNQWCDEASRKKTRILLEMGETVFIWPEELNCYKDIGDYIEDKDVEEFEQKIILDNLYRGLKGILTLDSIKNR